MPRKICFVTKNLSKGGAQRVLTGICNHLVGRNYEVVILLDHKQSVECAYPLRDEVSVQSLDWIPSSSKAWASFVAGIRRYPKMATFFRRERFDLVVGFLFLSNIRAIIAARISGTPVIVSERNHPDFGTEPMRWRVKRRIVYPFAREVVVQTDSIAEVMRRKGIRSVAVVPNPAPAIAPAKRVFDLPRPCFLAVGRLEAQKGFDLLLEAFAQFSRQNGEWHLVIAGEGSERQRLENIVMRSQLAGRVTLLGVVEEVFDLMRSSDVFVLSSRYEGMPNALLEALCWGLPCIATDCPGGPRDLIKDGWNGLLVETESPVALFDAMNRLANDPPLREQLAKAALQTNETFNRERILGMWEAKIREHLR